MASSNTYCLVSPTAGSFAIFSRPSGLTSQSVTASSKLLADTASTFKLNNGEVTTLKTDVDGVGLDIPTTVAVRLFNLASKLQQIVEMRASNVHLELGGAPVRTSSNEYILRFVIQDQNVLFAVRVRATASTLLGLVSDIVADIVNERNVGLRNVGLRNDAELLNASGAPVITDSGMNLNFATRTREQRTPLIVQVPAESCIFALAEAAAAIKRIELNAATEAAKIRLRD